MKDLLAHARENKYAVGAFNVTNIDLIDHILDAAVESNSPVILQLAEVHFRYLNLEDIAPALVSAANKVSVPVCVHLDHGKSLKTMIRAIRAGFTSIMYDGSEHPLEENAKNTKEVVIVIMPILAFNRLNSSILSNRQSRIQSRCLWLGWSQSLIDQFRNGFYSRAVFPT